MFQTGTLRCGLAEASWGIAQVNTEASRAWGWSLARGWKLMLYASPSPDFAPEQCCFSSASGPSGGPGPGHGRAAAVTGCSGAFPQPDFL